MSMKREGALVFGDDRRGQLPVTILQKMQFGSVSAMGPNLIGLGGLRHRWPLVACGPRARAAHRHHAPAG